MGIDFASFLGLAFGGRGGEGRAGQGEFGGRGVFLMIQLKIFLYYYIYTPIHEERNEVLGEKRRINDQNSIHWSRLLIQTQIGLVVIDII